MSSGVWKYVLFRVCWGEGCPPVVEGEVWISILETDTHLRKITQFKSIFFFGGGVQNHFLEIAFIVRMYLLDERAVTHKSICYEVGLSWSFV